MTVIHRHREHDITFGSVRVGAGGNVTVEVVWERDENHMIARRFAKGVIEGAIANGHLGSGHEIGQYLGLVHFRDEKNYPRTARRYSVINPRLQFSDGSWKAEPVREHSAFGIAKPSAVIIEQVVGAYGIKSVDPATPGALVCGECGRGWLEDITPAGRCPFEYMH